MLVHSGFPLPAGLGGRSPGAGPLSRRCLSVPSLGKTCRAHRAQPGLQPKGLPFSGQPLALNWEVSRDHDGDWDAGDRTSCRFLALPASRLTEIPPARRRPPATSISMFSVSGVQLARSEVLQQTDRISGGSLSSLTEI